MARGDDDLSRLTGRFWLADATDNVVAGVLDLAGGAPRLDLVGSLTPMFADLPTSSPNVRRRGAAPARPPATIHGLLVNGKYVTIFEAISIRHRIQAFDESAGEQSYRGSFAVLGSLFNENGTGQFNQFKFRVRYIDHWMALPGLSAEIDSRGRGARIDYKEPAVPAVDLSGVEGRLKISPAWTFAPPRATGSSLSLASWLQVTCEGPLSLREIVQHYVQPFSALLTLLFNEHCPTLAIEVEDPESGYWCEVFAAYIGTDTRDIPNRPLIDLPVMKLECVASWFDVTRKFTPMVQLVAASVSDSGRTIQNLLLELATAAEGLHRRLRPDARQMTVEEVDAAVEAIEVSEMGQNAKQILVNALNVFMAELSYPKRLVDLADIARQIVPDVTGRTNRWKARVANARVGFAHQLAKPDATDPLSEYFVLSRSLRWLLTAVLLLESGIDVAILASSFNVFDPYQQFLRLAKDQLPFVYDQVGTAASAPARRLADDGSAERRSASDVPTGTTPSEAAPPAVVAQSSRSTPTEDDVSKPSGATATDESDRSDDPPAAAAPPESAF